MKIYTRVLALAGASLALVLSVRAQLTTFDTRPNYTGSTFTFGNGSTQGETFTGIYAVSSLTYNFFAGSGGGGTTPGDTLTAVFGEWNGTSFVGGTTVNFGTITIPASGSLGWITIPGANSGSYPTFQTTFDLTNTSTNNVANSTLYNPISSAVALNSTYGYVTNAGTTYALMLTDTGGGNNLALGLTNSDVFPGGATNLGFNDWVFAQISVATSDPFASVPEASTVASVAALAMVAGLVGFRVRQRRQLTAAPVAA